MRSDRERLSNDGEIDLVELMLGVWRRKLWVALVALPIIVTSVAYVMLVAPVYEAKLYVQPPSQKEIAQLNNARGGESGLLPYTVKDVYEIYLKALQSEALRNTFFRNEFLPLLTDEQRNGSRDALYSQFNSLLKVAQAGKDMPSRYVVTANLEDPGMAAQWVKRYVEMAAERAKLEVLDGSQSDIRVLSDNLEREIHAAQAGARQQRLDQIAQLTEALAVAQSIGLKKPPIISAELSAQLSAGMDGSLTYMRGSDALTAEIKNLESRVSDDPFIIDLRQKQEKLSAYRAIKVEPVTVSAYQQDGDVEQPDKPIKPRKALIVLLSAVAGLGLGVIVALGRDVWVRRREMS